jgi:hypothetical protein
MTSKYYNHLGITDNYNLDDCLSNTRLQDRVCPTDAHGCHHNRLNAVPMQKLGLHPAEE